ncbi:MAG: MoxR family ATPase [Gammaproteobacteria bacterium]|nr:MoxR family ATPase [Gammaproteobacteria bacterium]
MPYPFNLIRPERESPPIDPDWLQQRPYSERDRSFEAEAEYFVPGRQLTTAMNTAIAVGEPLLITGEPGTGKTQAGYYAAYKLNTDVLYFQVKSEHTARDLLYHFNTVQYFHDAHLQNLQQQNGTLDKRKYVEPRVLWQAFDYAEKTGKPAVVLIDEIDKAPRDFPNDLLHELDKMEFTVAETGDKIKPKARLAPIVFITSNSERRLPEPFLRRCVYHHIEFNDKIVEQAVQVRRSEFDNLSDDFIALAIRRFLALRDQTLRKRPATGEFLVWLRVLSLAMETEQAQLEGLSENDLAKLPYLGVLLKDHKDISELGG